MIQTPVKGFRIDMTHYAKDVSSMKINRPIKDKNGKFQTLLDTERSQGKAVNGAIGWLGNHGRPELAAAHSMIASSLSSEDGTTEVVTDLNYAVGTAKEVQYQLQVHPILPHNLRYVGFFDASYDPLQEKKSVSWDG